MVFLGSGASAGCYDPWHTLVNELCKRCQSPQKVTNASLPDELLRAAEEAKRANLEQYCSYLHEHFARPVNLTNPLYEALLACNFRSYLTVNFDPLLAEHSCTARIPCNTAIQWYPHDLPLHLIDKRTIYYLHGYIGQSTQCVRDGDIVLSRSEFEKAYQHDRVLNRFLIETLTRQDMCFIACRLREPALKHVLDVCKQEQVDRQAVLQQRGGRPHKPPLRYILLQDPDYKAVPMSQGQVQMHRMNEERRLADFDIVVRWYNADHSILTDTFRTLAGLPRPKLSGLGDGDDQYDT